MTIVKLTSASAMPVGVPPALKVRLKYLYTELEAIRTAVNALMADVNADLLKLAS